MGRPYRWQYFFGQKKEAQIIFNPQMFNSSTIVALAGNVLRLGVRLGFWKTNVQLKTKDKYGN